MGKVVRKTERSLSSLADGNLGTSRFGRCAILKRRAAYVYCEDTVRPESAHPLWHQRPHVLLHAHSSDESIAGAISRLHEGSSIATSPISAHPPWPIRQTVTWRWHGATESKYPRTGTVRLFA